MHSVTCCCFLFCVTVTRTWFGGAVDSSVVRVTDSWLKGSRVRIPAGAAGRIFFSRINFLCWLLFRYPFHPRVTAVARKRSRSFCQKCSWQVTAKHACALRMWLCMKMNWCLMSSDVSWHIRDSFAWSGTVHGYMVYTERAEMAAVSCGTSHASAVSTSLRWIFKNAL